MTKKEIMKSEEDWRKKLTPEQYEICRNKGTERPFSGEYNDCKDKGIYKCVCCGNELFGSETKFNSGTGWPSFWAPINAESVEKAPEYGHGMIRVEVRCGKCGAHLGHVFDDGPAPTNKRYCINSVALKLSKESEENLRT